MVGGMFALWLFGVVGGVPPSSAGGTPLQAPAREQVLILDTDVRLLPTARDLGGQLPSTVARLLGHYRQIEPLTSDDVRALSSLEAQRQEAGCDSSCAVEIANALGARHVVVLQLLRDPLGMRLTVSLIDGQGGSVVGRSSIAGSSGSELLAQLPFAVDGAVVVLRHANDPPVGAIAADNASLAVLPLRFAGAPFAGQARLKTAMTAAARGAADRLGLGLLDEAAVGVVVKAAGCAVDDQRCGLPLLAMNGARLALRVSVSRGESVQVRAALLRPDGTARGESERALVGVVDDDRVIAALVTVIDEACGGGRAPTAPADSKTDSKTDGKKRAPALPLQGRSGPGPLTRAPARPATAVEPDGVRHVAGDRGDDDDEATATWPELDPEASAAPPPRRRKRAFVAQVECGKRKLSGLCLIEAKRLHCAALSSSKGEFVLDVALADIKAVKETADHLRLKLVDGSTCALAVDDDQRDVINDWLVPGSPGPSGPGAGKPGRND